ncbi:MAG TPA: hydantoinase/oxoprolinase family protein [bacterium]|nr:hydantoinase/oxoprolinase family protein [bacterium]
MARYRITVDTGGTFSDFVLFNEETGEIRITKIPSTPEDPSRAILQGIRGFFRQGIKPEEVTFFSHGTTVGTNTLLEERGARTGLLITKGFRGVYEVMEQAREYGPGLYNLYFEKPALLAQPSQTFEITERIDSQGKARTPLDLSSVSQAIEKMKRQGIESVAICFLFSFMNPEHEKTAATLVQKESPGCMISLSSEILPQIREYFRLSTTIINAYIGPRLGRYLESLESHLLNERIRTRQLYVMQSNGGVSTFSSAAKKGVTTLLSGPAAGVIAGVGISRRAKIKDFITFDMGGTSCDVSLIKDLNPGVTTQGKVNGRPVALPMLDIHTVSAGGGTIARIDSSGVLQVGPRSAGADPGPVCYDKGGEDVTITDANLVLGILNPENFLGGKMRLNGERARSALKEKIADPLGLTLFQAAEGIVKIVNAKMEEAIKTVSSQHGYDPRELTIISFGGAGPIHAARIAQDLGSPKVLVPRTPGVTSALGLLMSDVKHDYVRSKLESLESLDREKILEVFQGLEEQARADLKKEGFPSQDVFLEFFLDMRYANQGYELITPVPAVFFSQGDRGHIRRSFDDLHEKLFGHRAESQPVEVVSYRVVSWGRVPAIEFRSFPPGQNSLATARRGERKIYFGEAAGFTSCPVYERNLLESGYTIPGPAIVEQEDSTIVIFPGQTGTVDSYHNILIETNS